MRTYSLAIAWNWEFDADFIAGIERECARHEVTTYRVDPNNLDETLKDLRSGELVFRALYDRASDADTGFLPLVDLLKGSEVFNINPHDLVVEAVDKATMHLKLLEHGLEVPWTIILPPYNSSVTLSISPNDLDHIGKPFVIKPANTTGGGTGVVLHAATIQDVLEARLLHRDDKYLLQEKLNTKDLDGKRAWFRVYCVFGEIIPCWWDDRTHRYSELLEVDEARFGLHVIRDMMRVIEGICKLDFFSSEITLTEAGKFVVVDYVNEVCDMRLQSIYDNGAPDAIVHRIEGLIAEQVDLHLREMGRVRLMSTGSA